MRIRETILLIALLAAVLSGPLALGALILGHPTSWVGLLAQFQGLASALTAVFAAGLAAVGVLASVASQRENLGRQLEDQRNGLAEQLNEAERRAQAERSDQRRRDLEERDEQRRTFAYQHHLEQQQLASAFLGEVVGVLEMLAPRLPTTIEGDPTPIYHANAAKIGLLPAPVPARLAEFYALTQVFLGARKHLGDPKIGAVLDLDAQGWAALVDKELERLREVGTDLVGRLTSLEEGQFQWPPAPPKLMPGQIAALGQLAEQTLSRTERDSLLAARASAEQVAARVSEKLRARDP